jgi:hypothetical protein
MTIWNYLAERSLFALALIAVVLALTGLPKAKWRYRTILFIVGVLSLAAASMSYFSLEVGLLYHEQGLLMRYAAVVVFLIVSAAVLVELVMLWAFRRLVARERKNA